MLDAGAFVARYADVVHGVAVVAQLESRRAREFVLATHPMPSMNGIELAGVIKARPNPPAVVVIINAGSDAEFERQCAAAGADFCTEKRHLQARGISRDLDGPRLGGAVGDAQAPRERPAARAAYEA